MKGMKYVKKVRVFCLASSASTITCFEKSFQSVFLTHVKSFLFQEQKKKMFGTGYKMPTLSVT